MNCHQSRPASNPGRRRLVLFLLAFWGGSVFPAFSFGPSPSPLPKIPSAQNAVPNRVPGPEKLTVVGLRGWKTKNGDDPTWALSNFDDSGWEDVTVESGWRRRGTYWLRKELTIDAPPDESNPTALSFYNLPSAFEIYWDGELIGTNGRMGSDRSRETDGATRFLRIVGVRLTQPGRHLLAVRVSNHHVRKSTLITGIGLGPMKDLSIFIDRMRDKRLVSLGFYFIAGIFPIFLFIRGRKNPAFLFFGGYGLLFFAHSAWIYTVESLGLRVHAFAWVEPLVVFGISSSFFLLNAFLLWHFEMRRRIFHLVLQATMVFLVFALVPSLDLSVAVINAILTGYGFGLAAASAFGRKKGGGLALAGMTILAAYQIPALFSMKILAFLESQPGFFEIVLTGAFLSLLLGVIALKIRDENRSLHALEVRARRLEADLLKKSIQPHFIMNTLLSIQSWFGRDPAKAGRLIEALAEEFRIINQISSQSGIEAAEEIALCRSHLELMGYRRDAIYALTLDGDFSGLKIPPMLFHTLVENGLTHAYGARENGHFRLACVRAADAVEYTLENDGSRLSALAAAPAEKTEEGLGLKYVRTRLEESFPERWKLEYGLTDSRWRVRITIKKAKTR